MPGKNDRKTATPQPPSCGSSGVTYTTMPARFNLYFAEGEEELLNRGKAEIKNLSAFFKDALKQRLKEPKQETHTDTAKIFDRKFADFQKEADIRTVFETKQAAEPALKNRLTELRKTHPKEFCEILEHFRNRYPAYAHLTEEL